MEAPIDELTASQPDDTAVATVNLDSTAAPSTPSRVQSLSVAHSRNPTDGSMFSVDASDTAALHSPARMRDVDTRELVDSHGKPVVDDQQKKNGSGKPQPAADDCCCVVM